jgi:hypothetical protein
MPAATLHLYAATNEIRVEELKLSHRSSVTPPRIPTGSCGMEDINRHNSTETSSGRVEGRPSLPPRAAPVIP